MDVLKDIGLIEGRIERWRYSMDKLKNLIDSSRTGLTDEGVCLV